ncbi:nucleotidyl transferase AbiEii/AbiGii toxin family protein [Nostocoides vanveenii]|uniref:nucleotidyl transferase AbiEii/AbiGii toxin family protein n=1 Tax=Nostocoides vanveenii TaxID=330835 RepID=UPI003CD061CA
MEVVEPANRLYPRRPLTTHPYRLYPMVDQIADKVCATMETNYPDRRRRSRVKDLVDLVVFAHTQRVDLDVLRVAIHAKRRMSGIAAFGHLDIPPAWHGTYAATATGRPDRRAPHRRERGRLDCGVHRSRTRQRRAVGHLEPSGSGLGVRSDANLSRESATRRQPRRSSGVLTPLDQVRTHGKHRPHEVGPGPKSSASGMWSPITVLYSPSTRQRAAGRGGRPRHTGGSSG